MPPDGIHFLRGEFDIILDQHGAFGAVAEGHQVVDRVERHLFPFPGLFVFDVPGAGTVEVGLAEVVEQCHDDHIFLCHSGCRNSCDLV